ncbi:MAG: malto-oligosyltrehalose trehalohydrolase [Nitrospirota bacterium]|nr:malto-oligosyltrehalose trehalohydrolase [Nitrospirota bacterium]MDH4359286.1 malto-oligosyltrehalose trehalohydrolase [Nitrospirota bacterium]
MKNLKTAPWRLELGASFLDASSVEFRVWAPQAHSLAVRIMDRADEPIPLNQEPSGYWKGTVPDISPGTRYQYLLNHTIERPDPASRSQPDGVHGPSEIIDPLAFSWTDREWRGLPLEQYIIYELHPGTFTPEGTFDAIISRLPYLRDEVGITAIELMPVAQCPGTRNWGYDGTYLFAPQHNYGGPDGLKRLVDASHAAGLAVIMDVVYNHLGPEGNYLGDFGPYFTDTYRTPWGSAINYDGPESDAVRHFVISNAVYWTHEYHMDALRLDAIHGIFDFSAKHLLQDIGEAVHAEGQRLDRQVHVIAESDLNDARIITPLSKGGYGLDGQWSDDFHHALHTVLTKERSGYYEDFGQLKDLANAIRDGVVYTGQYSPHRRRRHGNSFKQCSPGQLAVCAQNHDQIGNRAQGDRLSTLVSFDALKVANAAVLLSPYLPLLFMGEEYGETAPFLYFIDHGDPDLIEAVRQGRKREFAAFGWTDIPDPYDRGTFERSRLRPTLETNRQQQAHLRWCQALIHLRKSVPALGTGAKGERVQIGSHSKSQLLIIHRRAKQGPEALILLGFHKNSTLALAKLPKGNWENRLDSGTSTFGGQEEQLAPLNLTIQNSEKVSLKLPAYPAWIFVKTD